MNRSTASESCPGCGAAGSEPIYRQDGVPVQSSILLASRSEARAFPTGDLMLALCPRCGLVFNAAFDAGAVDYTGIFEESQHYSSVFSVFAENLIEDIVRRRSLRGRTVVEVGCGRGEFLARLCERGVCRGVGIDPGFRAERLAAPASLDLRFIPEHLAPRHAALAADLVLCRHTLEHIDTVGPFLAQLASLAGHRTDAEVVVETPAAERIFRTGAFWDVYYEHCNYFTEPAQKALFRKAGLQVAQSRRVFADQYILQYASPAASGEAGAGVCFHPGAEEVETARNFGVLAESQRAFWRRRVEALAGEGPVAIWGGGSKAVAFLSGLDRDEAIRNVIDINPHKRGSYLPRSGHKVVLPEDVASAPPASIVVLNPVYEAEVRTRIAGLGIDANVTSLPR